MGTTGAGVVSLAIFRQLLGYEGALGDLDVAQVIEVARRNHVLLALARTMRGQHASLRTPLSLAAAAEAQRIDLQARVRGQILANATAAGVRVCFIKTKEGACDQGGDIDLLVFTRDRAVDVPLLHGLTVTPRKAGAYATMAARTEYETRDGVEIEILHGSAGRCGQLSALVPVLKASVDDCGLPSLDHQVLCAVALRLYDQGSVRLTDIAFFLTAIQECNRAEVAGLCRRLGILGGFEFCLALVRDYCALAEVEGFPAEAGTSAAGRTSGPRRFVPAAAFTGADRHHLFNLNLAKMKHELLHGQFGTAGRTAVLAVALRYAGSGRAE